MKSKRSPARPSAPEVVVVIGGSSGIGRATAIAYARRRAHVVVVARSGALLEEVAAECRRAGAGSAEAIVADVLDAEAVDRAFAAVVGRLGRIDTVVHAAAVMAYGTIEELPRDVLEHVVDTSTHGTANVARAALRTFRAQQRGTLLLVTSLLASVPVPGIGAYITGKWAQLGMASVLRLETRDSPGIVVTTVAPGAVDTPIYRRAANVVGRIGKPPPPVYSPERVAEAIVRAVDRRRQRVSIGATNQLIVAGFRFSAPLYRRLVGPLYQRLALGGPIAPTAGNVFEPSEVVDDAPR